MLPKSVALGAGISCEKGALGGLDVLAASSFIILDRVFVIFYFLHISENVTFPIEIYCAPLCFLYFYMTGRHPGHFVGQNFYCWPIFFLKRPFRQRRDF